MTTRSAVSSQDKPNEEETCNDVLVSAEDCYGYVRPANVPDVETEVKQLSTAGQVIRPLRPPLDASRRRYRLHGEYWSVDVSLVGTGVKHLQPTPSTFDVKDKHLRLCSL